jgi:hypothetical protein
VSVGNTSAATSRIELAKALTDVSAVDELQELIKKHKVTFVEEGKTLSEEQLRVMLARMLSSEAFSSGGGADAVDLLRRTLNNYADKGSGANWEVEEFCAVAYAVSQADRADEQIIKAFSEVMGVQGGKKEAQRDDLKSLAAELKIFGVIQSKINAALSSKTNIRIGWTSWTKNNMSDLKPTAVNLMDKSEYGYTTEAEWEASSEHKLLTGLSSYRPGEELSIKDFLVGTPKESGGMKLADLKDEYDFEKENNPLANLATMVGDRSRPVNDRLSEKTALLNDVSSRYNAAIEALNRFITKYNEMLAGILRAI